MNVVPWLDAPLVYELTDPANFQIQTQPAIGTISSQAVGTLGSTSLLRSFFVATYQ